MKKVLSLKMVFTFCCVVLKVFHFKYSSVFDRIPLVLMFCTYIEELDIMIMIDNR